MIGKMRNISKLVLYLLAIICTTSGLPDEGKWDDILTNSHNVKILSKSLYKGGKVYIRINCYNQQANNQQSNITVNLNLQQWPCWNIPSAEQFTKKIKASQEFGANFSDVYYFSNTYKCSEHIIIDESKAGEKKMQKSVHPVHEVAHDGLYVLIFTVNMNATDNYVGVHIEIKNDYGYLSAIDWPLLPFYGFMCIYYVILGLIWLILSFMQWRDLLRVQFWIGGVILLGMLEKATFYAEYQSINNNGTCLQGAMLFAEWVSCAKRTVARMLVVIVSLGFGIVKPRLGATLHRVVGVGLLYFFLAATESYLRITKAKTNASRDLLVASVPLAVLDSAICWWIFSALVNTTRTLRLRRNETKLALYRHFTNTLIFSVVASVFFMLYYIKVHHIVLCLKAWRDIWLEEAYWHILFSALLLVIMILWRPTNNNQRYAFVPLLDTYEGDDDEEEQLVNDAYGVKVRMHNPKVPQGSRSPRTTVEDDLKWLEENVKSDPALPILDSDEELVNTRFEVSKMQ